MTHLDRNHPVRLLLDEAARGNVPSLRDIDMTTIPAGVSVTDVLDVARRCAWFGGQGDNKRAADLARDQADRWADAMTPEQRQATQPDIPQPVEGTTQYLDDIARRMFGN